jgi:hypothetical protein
MRFVACGNVTEHRKCNRLLDNVTSRHSQQIHIDTPRNPSHESGRQANRNRPFGTLSPRRHLHRHDPRCTKLADPPADQPTNFERLITQTTAKPLDLTIPRSMLLRVDKLSS